MESMNLGVSYISNVTNVHPSQDILCYGDWLHIRSATSKCNLLQMGTRLSACSMQQEQHLHWVCLHHSYILSWGVSSLNCIDTATGADIALTAWGAKLCKGNHVTGTEAFLFPEKQSAPLCRPWLSLAKGPQVFPRTKHQLLPVAKSQSHSNSCLCCWHCHSDKFIVPTRSL